MCITIARCRSHVPTRQTARATSTWNGCIGLPGVHHRDPLLGVWRSRQPPLVRMVCQRAAAWPPPPPGRARLRILRQTFLPSVGTTSFSRGVRKGNAQSKRRETLQDRRWGKFGILSARQPRPQFVFLASALARSSSCSQVKVVPVPASGAARTGLPSACSSKILAASIRSAYFGARCMIVASVSTMSAARSLSRLAPRKMASASSTMARSASALFDRLIYLLMLTGAFSGFRFAAFCCARHRARFSAPRYP